MGCKIVKTATYLPEKVLTNNDLAIEFNRWEPEKIEAKLGIRERHITAKHETAGDLAFNAAETVLDNYDKDRIDMIIFCTQSPDYFLPATACILQKKLGLRNNVAAYDFNQGCSGYIYGLAMAKAFINSGIAENVLLLVGETYSKHIHPKDLANRTIFGDGAAATIIEKQSREQIYEFILGTDGAGKNNLIVPNGCFRSEYDENAIEITNNAGDIYTDNHLYMNGPEIFNFTIEAVPSVVNDCLLKNNLTLEEIDYVIFHQANSYMIEYLRKKIKIPKEKFYSNMLLTGNTVSATIPIALDDCLNHNIVKLGDKVLLCGFGVGYSWGAVIIEV
ncbi:MAG: ketoacyl-ACP synthase III [Bacteroidetes bacterium]|nr:ketoacyl-ACP synthase III [Bacteroidota bacterium]